MPEDVNAKARNWALVFGALIYTAVQTVAWWPDLTQPVTLQVKIAGFILRATTLVVLVATAEYLVLLCMTWRIPGEWVYQETSDSWGHARIALQGLRLRYSVDLYKTREDLLNALDQREPVPTMGHGKSYVSFLYPDGRFCTWYHVPAYLDYPERHGTLTLEPTLNPNKYQGTWERTGRLGLPAETSGDQLAAELARRDERQHAGVFHFFMRKKAFLSQLKSTK